MSLSLRGQAVFDKKSYCLVEGQSFEDRAREISNIIFDTLEAGKSLAEAIINKQLSPGGRIWYGVGRSVPFGNCYVLPIADNLRNTRDGILNIESDYGLIESLGGGIGINFTSLRPKGSPVSRGRRDIKSTEQSCGPIGFMKSFNEKVRQITGGGERKGATMAILHWNHPDILDFIKVKVDRTTLDMFNISIMFDKDFWTLLQDGDNRAVNIWNLFCENCYEHGEPGWLNYELINSGNNIWYYSNIEATNPCITGDTLVAVADGRNIVPIKQLAEEGRSLPVYCCDKSGKVYISTGHNPRITGKNVGIYKVTLDDGSFVKVSANHKFLLRNGGVKTTLELQVGDSLVPFHKGMSSFKSNRYWWVNGNKGLSQMEHRMKMEYKLDRGLLPHPFEVVHHKDYNGLNNKEDNLELTSQSNHDSFHQKGERNVMRGKWWNKLSDVEKAEYRRKMSLSCKGNKNGNYGNIYTLDSRKAISERQKESFKDPYRRTQAVKFLNKYRNIAVQKAIYNRRLKAEASKQIKVCPHCGKSFTVLFHRRGQIYCSNLCKNYSHGYRLGQWSKNNRNLIGENSKRWHKLIKIQDPIKYFNDKAKAGRAYQRKKALDYAKWLEGHHYNLEDWNEYRNVYKKETNVYNIPTFEIGIKFLGGMREAIDLISQYNHKIVKVEFVGQEDVYNITVDRFHTIALVTAIENNNGKVKYSGIITPQCGELPLVPFSCCMLGAVNFASLPVIESPSFHTEFRNIISLGVNFLTRCLIKSPYPIRELKDVAFDFRRIGLEGMGWADYLIRNNLRYGEPASIEFAKKFFELFRNYSYEASIKLAEEIGSFPGFEKENFMKSPFIQTLPEEIRKGIENYGIANCGLNTIGPTGTISQLFDASPGVEPIYDKEIGRNDRLGYETIYHPRANHPKFVTQKAGVTSEEYFEMKLAIQPYIDGAISGTVNVPEDITFDEFKKVLRKYVPLTKGGTVYREGSRIKEMLKGPSHRPYKLPSETYKLNVEREDGKTVSCFVTVTYKDGNPFEVFCTDFPGDSTAFVPTKAFTITVSMLLRAGVSPGVLTSLFQEYIDLKHTNLPSILIKLLPHLNDKEKEDKLCILENKGKGECKSCE